MKFIIGVTLLLLLGGSVLYLTKASQQMKSYEQSHVSGYQQVTPHLDKSKQVTLQEVHNLGYNFFVGEIDSASTTVITDDLKNQITKIAYNAHFPAILLKNIPIIVLNNLALTGDQYISTAGGNLKIPDLKPDFLSEGGIYVTFTNTSSVIFINKTTILRGNLTQVLTHELGHAVGSKLADQEWSKFYKLRSIASSTPRNELSWNLSPQEDFAEVYKTTFAGGVVQTYYGPLLPLKVDYEGILTCGKIYEKIYNSTLAEYQKTSESRNCGVADIDCFLNTPTEIQRQQSEDVANANVEVQLCRRDVLMHPEKYPKDYRLGTPYKTSVNQATKDFVVSIANRLNEEYSE